MSIFEWMINRLILGCILNKIFYFDDFVFFWYLYLVYLLRWLWLILEIVIDFLYGVILVELISVKVCKVWIF